MIWKNNISIRWIILLTPILIFILVMASFAVLQYVSKNTFTQVEQIQNREFLKAQFFVNIGRDLANNHIQVYEHMGTAPKSDEGEFYDKGKPLLLQIHSLENRLKNYININSSDAEITFPLNNVLTKLIDYRNNTTNAVLMATVDFKLAEKLRRESTGYYIELNNQFLKTSQLIQERSNRDSILNFAEAKRQFSLIIISLIIIVGLLIILSFILSRAFSQKFINKIAILKSLVTKNKPNMETTNNSDEIEVLSDVIENIQYTFETLKNTQLELSKQEFYLRSILDNMIDGVITINEEGEILYFSKKAEKMFGYKLEEIMGHNINQLMPEAYMSEYNGYLKNYVMTGNENIIGIGREVEGKKKTGECFAMHLSIGELPYPVNGKRCFIGAFRDITQIKEKEEQLHRSQKMDALGKLTGGIAHDYNNMLGVILGYTELLEMELKEQPKYLAYTSEIYHAAERGAILTKKLLTFSKQKKSDAVSLDINLLLQQGRSMLEKALTPSIELKYDLSDDIWPVLLDHGEVEDTLINLSINAMHAMDNNGQLIFQTRNESIREQDAHLLNIIVGDYVQLNISDTGCGMDEITRGKIFDPFFSTKGDKGTGLGLSQVFGFVSGAGGSIKVYSEPGHGTRFALFFPRNHDSINSTNIKNIPDITDGSGDETILVVDDEPSLLKICAMMLRPKGYKIITVESGKQALEILEKESVDLLLSDVIMPEMDGYELAEIVNNKYPAVKIQMTSGFSDDRHIKTTNDILHQSILSKPYTSNALLTCIRNLLDTKIN